jgi:hypothetical protein
VASAAQMTFATGCQGACLDPAAVSRASTLPFAGRTSQNGRMTTGVAGLRQPSSQPLRDGRSGREAASARAAGALVVGLVVGASLTGVAWAGESTAPPPSDRQSEAHHDADQLFERLVDRYRGLVLYKDSVKLAHRTVMTLQTSEGNAQEQILQEHSSSAEHSIGVTVEGSTLAVISSAFGLGGSCDALDASPLARFELARQLWSLPHLALRFADEPLASLRGGCGTLIPTIVEHVRIGERTLLRLHLESPAEAGSQRIDDAESVSPDRNGGGAGGGVGGGVGEKRSVFSEGDPRPTSGSGRGRASGLPAEPLTDADRRTAADPLACGPSTMDIFVNPESLLIERVEHVREIAEGVRYEATLEITPERAVAAPSGSPRTESPESTPLPPTPPTGTPSVPPSPSAAPVADPASRGPSIAAD